MKISKQVRLDFEMWGLNKAIIRANPAYFVYHRYPTVNLSKYKIQTAILDAHS